MAQQIVPKFLKIAIQQFDLCTFHTGDSTQYTLCSTVKAVHSNICHRRTLRPAVLHINRSRTIFVNMSEGTARFLQPPIQELMMQKSFSDFGTPEILLSSDPRWLWAHGTAK